IRQMAWCAVSTRSAPQGRKRRPAEPALQLEFLEFRTLLSSGMGTLASVEWPTADLPQAASPGVAPPAAPQPANAEVPGQYASNDPKQAYRNDTGARAPNTDSQDGRANSTPPIDHESGQPGGGDGAYYSTAPSNEGSGHQSTDGGSYSGT